MVICKKCGYENTVVSFKCSRCGIEYLNHTKNPKRPIRNKYLTATILIAIGLIGPIVLFMGYAYASPYLTLWQIRNAIVSKDYDALSSHIDFPSLRQSLKDEMNAYMMADFAKDDGLKSNPFAGLAMVLAPGLINNMVDGLITPAGVERLLTGNFRGDVASNSRPTPDFLNDPEVKLGYQSLNEFWVIVRTERNEKMALVFHRHWIGDWKLSGVRMPR